jgi:hypothetical protein
LPRVDHVFERAIERERAVAKAGQPQGAARGHDVHRLDVVEPRPPLAVLLVLVQPDVRDVRERDPP